MVCERNINCKCIVCRIIFHFDRQALEQFKKDIFSVLADNLLQVNKLLKTLDRQLEIIELTSKIKGDVSNEE